jgi:sugar lactone lactonase YvrE
VTGSPKPPIDPVRWQPPPVDPLPDFPSAEVTIVEVPGDAPEDVVVDEDGRIWTGLEDGRIVRISPDDGKAVVVGDTGGRPLGLAFSRDGRLLVCSWGHSWRPAVAGVSSDGIPTAPSPRRSLASTSPTV